jgi:integrase
MRWADVRFDEASVVLREHKTARKTGRPRVIPLVPTVIKLLLWMRARTETPCSLATKATSLSTAVATG